MPMFTVLVLLFVVGAATVAFWLGRVTAPPVEDPRTAGELAERDAFIEQLRELAWQHRDVSPELSTIVIDEITQHHRRGLPGAG